MTLHSSITAPTSPLKKFSNDMATLDALLLTDPLSPTNLLILYHLAQRRVAVVRLLPKLLPPSLLMLTRIPTRLLHGPRTRVYDMFKASHRARLAIHQLRMTRLHSSSSSRIQPALIIGGEAVARVKLVIAPWEGMDIRISILAMESQMLRVRRACPVDEAYR